MSTLKVRVHYYAQVVNTFPRINTDTVLFEGKFLKTF